MLKHTFCHLPGIGPVREQGLWRLGITAWDDPRIQGRAELGHLGKEIAQSREKLRARDLAYFARRLPSPELWRLFQPNEMRLAFLDIETTGTGYDASITTVAVCDGTAVHAFVARQNLDQLPTFLDGFDLLITYNGASFDLPFIRRCLNCALTQAHLDLRHVLASLGLKGGLKAVERKVGIDRPGLEDVDGYTAVLLWLKYQRTRDPRMLETLLAYNAQDAINLAPLAIEAFNRKVARTPFAHLALPQLEPIANPYRADEGILRSVSPGQTAIWE